MELAVYIKKLLYNHDSLVIPQFGKLITHYHPAEINAWEHSISPPSKYLTFDKNILKTDGLLANCISADKAISIEEAEAFILSEVQILVSRLDERETILFEGIGYFSKEADVIRFEREPLANFLTDTFGLSNIDYKALEFKHIPKKNNSNKKSRVLRIYSMVWMFAISLAAISIAMVVYLNYPEIANTIKAIHKTAPVAVIPDKVDTAKVAPEQKDTILNDTTKESDLEKFFDSATDKKRALALTTAPQATSPNIDVTYYIIAGSFKTYQRAQVMNKALINEGFKPEIIQFEQDKFRVSLGEYKEIAEAQAQFDKITATKGVDAVWILKK